MRYNYITMIEGLGGKAERLPEVPLDGLVVDRAEYPQ